MEKCQFCGKPAAVHVTQIINNKTTIVHMCAECAAKEGLFSKEGLPFAMLANIGDALLGGLKHQFPANGLICSKCGCTPMSFKETGRLGCPNCYKDLKPLIDALIESSQKGMFHKGKNPNKKGSAIEKFTADASKDKIVKLKERDKKQTINGLRKDLAAAVKAENYEEAAKLRDKIKELESKEGTSHE